MLVNLYLVTSTAVAALAQLDNFGIAHYYGGFSHGPNTRYQGGLSSQYPGTGYQELSTRQFRSAGDRSDYPYYPGAEHPSNYLPNYPGYGHPIGYSPQYPSVNPRSYPSLYPGSKNVENYSSIQARAGYQRSKINPRLRVRSEKKIERKNFSPLRNPITRQVTFSCPSGQVYKRTPRPGCYFVYSEKRQQGNYRTTRRPRTVRRKTKSIKIEKSPDTADTTTPTKKTKKEKQNINNEPKQSNFEKQENIVKPSENIINQPLTNTTDDLSKISGNSKPKENYDERNITTRIANKPIYPDFKTRTLTETSEEITKKLPEIYLSKINKLLGKVPALTIGNGNSTENQAEIYDSRINFPYATHPNSNKSNKNKQIKQGLIKTNDQFII